MSSSRENVPRSSSAPTVMTHGSFAGENVTPSLVSASLPGGRDHHDPGVPRLLGGRVERIGPVGLGRVRRQRQVDHPDAVLSLVVHRELDPGDHVEDGGVAVVVGDLDRDQVGPRSDAHVPAVVPVVGRVQQAVSGDQPGNVRAVSVIVRGVRGARVGHGRRDNARAVPAGRLEVGDIAGDAGVDHRDAHPAAGGRGTTHGRRGSRGSSAEPGGRCSSGRTDPRRAPSRVPASRRRWSRRRSGRCTRRSCSSRSRSSPR